MLAKDILLEKFLFRSKSFKDDDFGRSFLCIQVSKDSLIYLIADEDKNIQYVKHVQLNNGIHKFNFADFLNQEELLKKSFKKVQIIAFDLSYTIVPSAFYNENQKEEILKFTAITGKNDIFLHDELRASESKLIYSIDDSLKEMIDKKFPNHSLICGISQLINLFIPSKEKEKTGLLHFRKNAVDILLYNKKIVFCNSFSILSIEDVMYFLLAAIELNMMNNSEIELQISGEIEKDSIWIKMIKKYFSVINYKLITELPSASLPFEQNIQHQYYQLYQILRCA
jgi:hypothetical protein